MAFLIPDNLRSRDDVPGGIKRVAAAFQIGLDENVVVWYEPLYDPSQEKPHLVVLLPAWGIVVLEALEIKPGGLLGVIRGRIRVEVEGRETEVKSPLERAKKLADVLKERVAAESRLEGHQINIASGAILASVTREEAINKGLEKILPIDKCLFKNEIDAVMSGSGETGLVRAFARMLGGIPEEELPGKLEKILRGIIQPETVIDKVSDSKQPISTQLTIFRPPEGDDDTIRIMDRQQEAMAKSLGEGHRVIRGVAGSGKTLILVYRAKLLARLFPQYKFLVTCYTRSLAGQLKSLLGEFKNIDVINLDQLMARTIKQGRLRHPGYKDDEGGERVAQVALSAQQKGAGPVYRAVLLDEAQDFGTTALKFVVGLLQQGQEDLVIVADAAQNIFRRKFSWKQAGIQAQGRTRILRTNYRNTKEILEFASKFLLSSSILRPDEVPDPEDENVIIPPEAAARSGPEPELYLVQNDTEEVNRAIEQVIKSAKDSLYPKKVSVLYSSSRSGHVDRAKSIYDGLKKEGIGVFWVNDPLDKTAKDRLAEVNEPVVLTTIHSAKGLEFQKVILCGIWRDDQDMESNRKLAYVGMTRAMEHLTIVSTNTHPLADDLRRAAE